MADAAARGVGAGLVLLVLADEGDHELLVPGSERCPTGVVGDGGTLPARVCRLQGGPDVVLALLDEQIARKYHRVPTLDDDPAWTVRVEDLDPARRRLAEALLCLSSGGVTTRGVLEEDRAGGPRVLASGRYRKSRDAQELRPLPSWAELGVAPAPERLTRVLDLRTGCCVARSALVGRTPGRTTGRTTHLVRCGRCGWPVRSDPGWSRSAPRRRRDGSGRGPPLGRALDAPGVTGRVGSRWWARAVSPDSGDRRAGPVVAARQRLARPPGWQVVERVACYVTSPAHPLLSDALERLDAASDAGFDRLLHEQRAVWARRWEVVDVRIPADPGAQRALRFVLFHLWGLSIRGGHELAVGARGATGPGCRGHVFWDADVAVLPALASIDPAASRAMVRYRIARLPAARRAACRAGHAGARFPRQSASRGEDVTPATGLVGDRREAFHTGAGEEHVTADVAWAAVYHARWCAEPQFLLGPARALVLETARYWAARCRVDARGGAHLDGVIGPDEYHEDVDDDAYTNVMARWHLRTAADLADRLAPDGAEARSWRDLAERLVDGLDPLWRRHEQFAGYDALDRLEVTDVAAPPVAADILLGRERAASTQLIKQPDVLLLHHLVPQEAGLPSLGPDVEFYAPWTAHDSSLSPGITSAVLARAGRTEEALHMLRLALALALDDLAGTAGTGLPSAALGAAWQAVFSGFAGVRVEGRTLCVDPRPPAAWTSFEIRFRCLGRPVRLEIDHNGATVRTDLPLRVRLHGTAPVWVHDTIHALRPGSRSASPSS